MITFLTPERMEELLEKKQWQTFYDLHATIASLYQDGMPLSEDMLACLLYPFKKYGYGYAHWMHQMEKRQDEPISMKGAVGRWNRDLLNEVTGEDAAELIKGNEVHVLNETMLALKTLGTTQQLNDDQLDFIELAEHFLHK